MVSGTSSPRITPVPKVFSYLCVYELEPDSDAAQAVADMFEAAKAGKLTRTEAISQDPAPRWCLSQSLG